MAEKGLFLGIDTGGTYTDGVLFDPLSRQVVQTVKVLTTHHDLEQCIAEVLEQLLPAEPWRISLISLSTTLATNAIAEGKRNPVALLLLGYDEELVRKFKFQHQFGTPYYYFIPGRHALSGEEQEALDEGEVERIVMEAQGLVEAIAIASYAGPVDSSHEERAAALTANLTSLPVVQAHHLSSELDSIRRATTASLNASLLSNAQDFLRAVVDRLVHKGVTCPVMIVRGDGSIVQADYVRARPVEIIHSGPATSTIGGHYLAGVADGLVIDIGGTTTDIALVVDGRLQIQEQAATVGPYRTCVRTIRTRSFGLGGDSLIHFDPYGQLWVGPERVTPLSRMCYLYPQLEGMLAEWLLFKHDIRYPESLEFWSLRGEPKRELSNQKAQKVVELLRRGPQRMYPLLKQVGAVSPVQVSADELIRQEIIERAALTPTDLLHVTNEFTPWNRHAAQIAVEAVGKTWREDGLAFTRRVREAMTEKLVGEVVQFLSGKVLSEANGGAGKKGLDRWLFEENLSPRDAFLSSTLTLKLPIIGIGAPARAFLPAVAQALHTEVIFPEHYQVANAVGTVVGKVTARQEGEVFPRLLGAHVSGYYGRVANHQQAFDKFEQARQFVRQELEAAVRSEMIAAGAGACQVELQEKLIMDGMIHMTAYGVGLPGMGLVNFLEPK